MEKLVGVNNELPAHRNQYYNLVLLVIPTGLSVGILGYPWRLYKTSTYTNRSTIIICTHAHMDTLLIIVRLIKDRNSFLYTCTIVMLMFILRFTLQWYYTLNSVHTTYHYRSHLTSETSLPTQALPCQTSAGLPIIH